MFSSQFVLIRTGKPERERNHGEKNYKILDGF